MRKIQKLLTYMKGYMTLGEKIRYLRTKKKISQKKLGEMLELHENHLARYEKNQSVPNATTLKNLCEFFHVSSDYLLFDKDENDISANISDVELLHQFEEIDQMDEKVKEHVRFFLNVTIHTYKIKQISA